MLDSAACADKEVLLNPEDLMTTKHPEAPTIQRINTRSQTVGCWIG